MAKWYGKCTNFGNCSTADKGTTIEILETESFFCPTCGKKLVPEDSAGWLKKTFEAVVSPVVKIGGAIVTPVVKIGEAVVSPAMKIGGAVLSPVKKSLSYLKGKVSRTKTIPWK